MESLISGLFAVVSGCVMFLIFFLVLDWWMRRERISNITDKFVLITGCDSGFGESACKHFDASGVNVIAACLTEDGVTRIRASCSSRLSAVQMDVSDMASVSKAVELVEKILPPGKGLWGIVNNAGVAGSVGPLEWLSSSDVSKLFDVNVFGMINVIQGFLPFLKRNDCGGRIVNTSSILGRISTPYVAPYCMSKHAVEAMSDSLRVELHPYKIRVAMVEPGAHQTAFLEGIEPSISSVWKKLPDSTKEQFGLDYLKHVTFLGTKLISCWASSSRDNVVNAYEHAMFSIRPRSRYLVGFDAIGLALMSHFPSILFDTIYLLPGLRAIPASCRKNK